MADVHILIQLVFHFVVTFIDAYPCVDYKSVHPSRTSNIVNSFLNMYMCMCVCVVFYIEYFSRTLSSSDIVLVPNLISFVCAVKKFSCEKLFSCKCVCHICGLHVVTGAYGSGRCFVVNPCAHLEFLTFYISKWLKTSKCVIFLCFDIKHKEVFNCAD